MADQGFFELSTEGSDIAVLTLDDPRGSANVFSRAVLDELLDKYAAFGPGELAPASLRVPPLSEMGSPVELANRFGGVEALREAIAALHDEIYAA